MASSAEVPEGEGSNPLEANVQNMEARAVELISDDAVGGNSPVEGLVASKPSTSTQIQTLEEAEALFEKGCNALKANDLTEAVDSLSRALEIRVAHFGELAPECATSYFKYGCALLYKAQDEADPLNESVALAKKEQASMKNVSNGTSEKDGEEESSEVPASEEKTGAGESSEVPVSEACAPPDTDAKCKTISHDNGKESTEKDNDEEDDDEGEESDEDAGEDVQMEGEDEDDSDLDLAWKMLESARVIHDRQVDAIEKVEVISALGDVSLEREDFSTSASDYLRALSILEGLREAEGRHIAELCFKLSLALQMQNKIPDALHYCQRALSKCTSCMEKLVNEVEASKVEMSSKNALEIHGSGGDPPNNALEIESKENEIKVLKGLMTDLSDKVEDFKQMMTEPPLAELVSSLDKNRDEDKFQFAFTGRNSQEGTVSTGFDHPKLMNAPSNGTVTDLGVVGRGVKRASPISIGTVEPPSKRLSIEPITVENPDSSAMDGEKSEAKLN